MSSLANALVSQVLGHSDAEKAFRPWWDNFEDYLVYALVMLGKYQINVPSKYCKVGVLTCDINQDQNPVFLTKNGLGSHVYKTIK